MNNMYKISAVEISHINMALQSRLEKIDDLLTIFSKDGNGDLYQNYTEERQQVQEIKDRLLHEFYTNVESAIKG